MGRLQNVWMGGKEFYVALVHPDHPILRWLGREGEVPMTHRTCPRCGKLWKISVSPLPKDDERSELCPSCVADAREGKMTDEEIREALRQQFGEPGKAYRLRRHYAP